jgi:hypothetical protein
MPTLTPSTAASAAAPTRLMEKVEMLFLSLFAAFTAVFVACYFYTSARHG